MKKFFGFMLVMMIAVALFKVSGIRAGTTNLSLTAVATTIGPGDPLDLDLVVSNGLDLAAYEFELIYDSTFFTYTDIVHTNLVGQTGACDPAGQRCLVVLGPKGSEGDQELGAYSYGNGPSYTGDGTLATMRLQSTGTTGTTTIYLRRGLTASDDAIADNSSDAAITITVGSPTAISLSGAPTASAISGRVIPLLLLLILLALLTILWLLRGNRRLVLFLLLCAGLSGLSLVGYAQASPEWWSTNPDLNEDRIIDIADIMLVSTDFGTADLTYDFDQNGVIDFYDLDRIGSRWHTRGAYVGTTSPSAGQRDVAVTRETIFFLNTPIDPTTVNSSNVYATFSGQLLPTTLHISPDNQRLTLFYASDMPPSSHIEVVLNGDQIADADGYALDADNDGYPGGVFYLGFDTLSLTVIPGTVVCGDVFASELGVDPYGNPVDVPLVNATITVDGRESELFTTTDATGHFCLDPAPAGMFFVHVDGRTATNPVAPGAYYPYVGKPWVSQIGQTVDAGIVYLPLVAPDTLQPVSNVSDTEIHMAPAVIAQYPDFAEVSITVPAGSLYADDGTYGGSVGIAPVPPDRLPGQLPPDLNFPLVITVQTDGPTNFDSPASVCFPNLPNPDTGQSLAPGEKSALWSFNHDTGEWEPAGPATVNGDGSLVCTDPGYGVRAPGWHGVDPSSLLRNAMCQGLDWDDFWDGVEVGANCLKKMPIIKQGLAIAATVADAAGAFADLAGNVWDLYETGGLNSPGSLLSAVDQMKTSAGDLQSIGEAVVSFSPAGQAYDGAQCAYEVGDFASSVLCKTLKCHAALLNSACDLVDHLKNTVEHIWDELGQIVDDLLGVGDATESINQRTEDLYDYVSNMPDPYPGGNPDPYVADEIADLRDDGQDIADNLAPAEHLEEDFGEVESLLNQIQAILLELLSKPGAFTGKWACLNVDPAHPFWCGYWTTHTWRVLAERPFDITVYDYEHNALLVTAGATARPGRTLEIGEDAYSLIYPLSGPDDDGDGIPSLVEDQLALDPNNADTDGDGMTDSGELENQTNPLDGILIGQGVIATVDTPGLAQDVCAMNDVAVVADGPTGITVVDVRAFDNPIIFGTIDTPGTAVQVACGNNLIAAADGGYGLTVVDATNPVSLSLLHTIRLSGSAKTVELVGNLAYVGTSTNDLWLVDVVSGATLGRYQHPAGIRDIQVLGDFLYFLDSGNLVTIDLRQGPFAVVHTLPIGSTYTRLFAGGNLLYAVHVRGYSTIDLTLPQAPALIASGVTGQAGWRQLVTSGSAIGVAVVGNNVAANTGDDVQLYDVSDPSQTNVFLQEISTPGIARAVAIYNGLAYVADFDAGLQVVNYQAFDSAGQTPTVSLSTNYAPGLVEEGKLLRLTATAGDDVDIHRVEFYVDGQVANRDGSFPFEYRFVSPMASVQATMTVQARAFDTGGNNSWTAAQVLTVVPDATPPHFVSSQPADGGSSLPETLFGVAVFASEPLDASSVSTETVKIYADGPDGTLGTADDVLQTGGTVSFDEESLAVLLAFDTPLATDSYRGEVTGVRDRPGNSQTIPFTWTFFVEPPVRWVNPAGGNWSTGSNWSSGTAPSSVSHVIVDLPGTYTITGGGGITVNTLEIVNPTATVYFSSAAPTIQADLTNYGTLSLRTGGALNVTNGLLYNAGTINIVNYSLGDVTINADIFNAGLLDVNDRLFLSAGRTLTNKGTIDVATGYYLDLGNQTTFDQLGGNIITNGDLRQNGTAETVTVNLSRGLWSSAAVNSTFWNGTVNVDPDMAFSTAYIILRGTSNWDGDIPAGLRLWLQSGVDVTAEQGFINEGWLLLGASSYGGGPYARFHITNGTLVNEGLLETTANGGTSPSDYAIDGDFVNNGDIKVVQILRFSRDGATVTNNGDIDLTTSSSQVEFNTHNITFNQNGGTILGPGALDGPSGYTGRTWNFAGGSASGLADSSLYNGNLLTSVNFQPVSMTIRLRGDSNTMAGDVPAGLTVWIQSNAQAVAENGFTNYGRILLGASSYGGSPYAYLTVNNGPLVNEGTIQTTANGGSGPESYFFYGDLVNNGLILTSYRLQFGKVGGVITNNGTIQIGVSTRPIIFAANDLTFNQAGGTIEGPGYLSGPTGYSGRTWNFTGGTATGLASSSFYNGNLVANTGFQPTAMAIELRESSNTISGAIPAGLTVWMRTNGAVTANTGFANYGTFQMGPSASGSGQSVSLTILDGYYLDNYGTIQTTSFDSTNTINGDVNNYGTFNFTRTIIFSKSGGMFANHGTILTGDYVGALLQNGYTLHNESDGNINGKGRMQSSAGVFSSVGVINPGNVGTAGQFDVTGPITLQSGNTLNLDLGGATVDTQYDRLAMSGACTLDGTLNLSLINAYDPAIGATFTVVTCSSLSGAFAQVNGLDIGNGKLLSLSYTATSVVLTVVAAP